MAADLCRLPAFTFALTKKPSSPSGKTALLYADVVALLFSVDRSAQVFVHFDGGFLSAGHRA
ncbi:MAG: hypothetical protein ACOCN0_00920, partial [Prevotella sp.]